jgi:hypothetical protein
MRASFLDHVPAAQSREAEAGDGTCVVTGADLEMVQRYELQDDPDDDDVDEDEDDDESDDEDADDEDDEDVETWQVLGGARSR